MEAYSDFAEVYDELMDDTPYEAWCEFLMGVFQRYGVDDVSKTADSGETAAEPMDQNLRQERNTILDLGCGTGTLTELLARRGYDMIGVDNAEGMLRIAMDKRERSGLDILYLLQDMREFELYGTVGAVVSVCDSVNYLLTEEDIVQTFERVNNYLYPQGLFIFDFNTVYKYAVMIGEATIAENRENCSFIWENYYDPEEMLNQYDLTLFIRQKGGLYKRYEETHFQRAYSEEQIRSLVKEAGMELLRICDADTGQEPSETTERIHVIAREHGKMETEGETKQCQTIL